MSTNSSFAGAGRPWSWWLAWPVLTGVLALGVPLILCMPLWCDATMYDLCARSLLRGGVHYRDTFDTNLPGMVWLHVLVRSALGWRPEVLGLVDLLVVSGVIVLAARWVGTGWSSARRLWTAVVLAVYYFSLPEICHCQRDVWMLLPALGALALRERRRLADSAPAGHAVFGPSFLEGLLWAAAFWIKPFVLIPALCCWLTSTLMVRRTPRRQAWLPDLLGLVAGGTLLLLAGSAWLIGSGAWPHFIEIQRHWNAEYFASGQQRGIRWQGLLIWMAGALPWSLATLITLLGSVYILYHGIRAARGPVPVRRLGPAPTLLAAFFVGWTVQAAFIQHPNIYVLAPLVFLAAPLFAIMLSWWNSRLARMFVLLVLAGFILYKHPLRQRERLALWPRCLQEGSTSELRDRLALMDGIGRTHWQELDRVGDFLREQGVANGEVTCYHNATHPLYLDLDLEPSTRFFQFATVLRSFPSQQGVVRRELAASRHRYVVSDAAGLLLDGGRPDELPPLFPWTEPIVFRTRHYFVHEVRNPVGDLIANPPAP